MWGLDLIDRRAAVQQNGVQRFGTQSLCIHFVKHPPQGVQYHGPSACIANRMAIVQ
jgi:hypothetical protein